MNSNLFITKSQFDDLEIRTVDGRILYVSKGWLYTISPYFSALLTNGFNASQTKEIYLGKRYEILLIFFKCVAFRSYIEKYIKKELDTVVSIHDFTELIDICEEYQCFGLKNVVDYCLSEDKKLRSMFGNGTDILRMTYTYNLGQTSAALRELLSSDARLLATVKFKDLASECLKIFVGKGIPWSLVVNVFSSWSKDRDPSDEELRRGNMFTLNWSGMPSNYNSEISKIIRKFTKAKDFKLLVYDNLTL